MDQDALFEVVAVPPVRPRASNRALLFQGMLWCSRCRTAKPVADFHRNKAISTGYANLCKVCKWEDQKLSRERLRQNAPEEYQRQREQMDRSRLKRVFKMTLEEYDAMAEAQGGVCAVCRQPSHARLCIDHDRSCCPGYKSCGRCVRALLCHYCNLAIGLLGEDPARIRAVASYVEAHRTEI